MWCLLRLVLPILIIVLAIRWLGGICSHNFRSLQTEPAYPCWMRIVVIVIYRALDRSFNCLRRGPWRELILASPLIISHPDREDRIPIETVGEHDLIGALPGPRQCRVNIAPISLFVDLLPGRDVSDISTKFISNTTSQTGTSGRTSIIGN